MRMIFWIFQTLMMRSWLIFGGILLGLAARYVWPAENDQAKTFPTAAQKFENIHQAFTPVTDEEMEELQMMKEIGDLPLQSLSE